MAKATRPTKWLLAGVPVSPTSLSPSILWRRFILHKDGDHAIWVRVMDFLASGYGEWEDDGDEYGDDGSEDEEEEDHEDDDDDGYGDESRGFR